MRISTWDGRAESLDAYAQNVELLVLGTHPDGRNLLGPRLVAELPAGSAQSHFALRLSRDPTVDGEGVPANVESIALANGAMNLVAAFRRNLGTQDVADIGAWTDADIYAARCRRPSAQWAIAPQGTGRMMPNEVRNVLKQDRMDPELASRDQAVARAAPYAGAPQPARAHFAEPPCAPRRPCPHINEGDAVDTGDGIGFFADRAGIGFFADRASGGDDVQAVKDHADVAEGEATNRTWLAAQKLLNDQAPAGSCLRRWPHEWHRGATGACVQRSASPLVRPSWDYKARVASRKYGLGDEKTRRSEERKQARDAETADSGGVAGSSGDNGGALAASASPPTCDGTCHYRSTRRCARQCKYDEGHREYSLCACVPCAAPFAERDTNQFKKQYTENEAPQHADTSTDGAAYIAKGEHPLWFRRVGKPEGAVS